MLSGSETSFEILLAEESGFAEYGETAAFADFEMRLEADLAALVQRWTPHAAPNAHGSPRRSKFPLPFGPHLHANAKDGGSTPKNAK
ncbi:MAG: hypothetical protein QM811_10265 [Pirellulales bacterium]